MTKDNPAFRLLNFKFIKIRKTIMMRNEEGWNRFPSALSQ